MIPYYRHRLRHERKLGLDGWSMMHRRVGQINDISSTMEDSSRPVPRPRASYPPSSIRISLPPDEEKVIEKAKAEEEAEKEREEAGGGGAGEEQHRGCLRHLPPLRG